MANYDSKANFQFLKVTVSPSPATSGTTFSVSNSDAALLPDPQAGGNTAYNLTIWAANQQPLSTNAEVVRVTAKGAADSGGTGNTQFTITRLAENNTGNTMTARSVQVGDWVGGNITKKWFSDIETNKLDLDGSQTMTGQLKTNAYTTGSVIYSDGTKLAQDNANLFYDATNHVLAIGTNTPNAISVFNSAALEIDNTGGGHSDIVQRVAGGYGTHYFAQSNGTIASPTATTGNNLYGAFFLKGFGGSTYQTAVTLSAQAPSTGSFSATSMPGDFYITNSLRKQTSTTLNSLAIFSMKTMSLWDAGISSDANFRVTQPSFSLPGLVTTNGTTTLVGTETLFTNDFKPGDNISVSGETVRVVSTITDDTHLVVTSAFSTTASNLAYHCDARIPFRVRGNGQVGLSTVPTAFLHLPAGTANATTAPLKFTSGTNLTTPEAGAIEYDGTNVYFTNSTPIRTNISYSPATKVVAPATSGYRADYYTTGTNDESVINTAILAVYTAGGGTVKLLDGGTFSLGASIVMYPKVMLWAYGATINWSSGSTAGFMLHDAYDSGALGSVDHISVRGGIWNRGASVTALVKGMILGGDQLNVRDVEITGTNGGGGAGFALQIHNTTNFLVENIYFNTNLSDGVHVSGPAARGTIRNVYGTTGDDMVAIMPNEVTPFSLPGDITDITVDGVKVNGNSHGNAVRILGGKSGATVYNTKRIKIRNVQGTLSTGEQGGIWIGNDNGSANQKDGQLDDITVDNISLILPDSTVPLIHLSGSATQPVIPNIKLSNINIISDMQAFLLLDAIQMTNLTVDTVTGQTSTTNWTGGVYAEGSTPNIENLILNNISVANGAAVTASQLLNFTNGIHAFNIHLSNIYVRYLGNLMDTVNTHNIFLSNIRLVNNSSGAGIFNIRSGAVVAVQACNGLFADHTGSTVTSTGTLESKSPMFPMDITNAQIVVNKGDMAYNTQASAAAGVGPVAYNGTAWEPIASTQDLYTTSSPKFSTLNLGVTSPTAVLHLKAGTATASTSPLKLTSGTNLTTPEDGAMEYSSSHLFFTIGSTRFQIDQQLAGSSVTSLTGTANQVLVNGTSGSATTSAITLTLPQSINTGATPQFTRLGLNQAADGTASLAATQTALGVTSTDGFILQNTTAAAVGAQQFSPRIRLTGQGWKTTATAASQAVDWIVENQPVQGAANPTTNLVFSFQVNAGGYSIHHTLTSAGALNLASGGVYQINGTSVLSGSTLGAGVTGSSLTSVGTITTGTWNGTTIDVAHGGTGQTTYTNGQLLIGNTTGNTLAKATLTAGNSISVTNGTGSITIDTIQDIRTTASPTFANATISSGLTITGTGAGSGSDGTLRINTVQNDVTALIVSNINDVNAFEVTDSTIITNLHSASFQVNLNDNGSIPALNIFNLTNGVSADATQHFQVKTGTSTVQDFSIGIDRTDSNFKITNAADLGSNFVFGIDHTSNAITTGVWNATTVGVLYGGTGTGTQFTPGSVVFAGASGVYAQDNTNFFWDNTNKRLGLGTASPTAILHLKAGTATANTAPLKFTSGTNLTTAEAGAMEFDGTHLYFSPSTTRYQLDRQGAPTFYVAASTAGSASKNKADYLCTGTNDDVQILAALAALPASGGKVVLSEGTFTVGAEVNITASNKILEGQGQATTITPANSANIRSVVAVTGTNTVYVQLKSFTVDGNKANQTSGSGIYIKTPGASFSGHVFQDLLVQNCKNDGIKTDNNAGSSSMYFLRVHAATCNGSGFNIFQDANGASLTDSVFDTCIAETNAQHGFYLGCIDTHFLNCKAYFNGSATGNYHGYYIAGYNQYFENCEAQDNYQSGFYSQNDGDATYGSQNCVFINCDGDSNNQAYNATYGVGFQLKNVTGWMLIGCQAYVRPYPFAWGQKYGVSLEGTTNNTQITNLQGTGNLGVITPPGVATAATAAGTTLGVGVYRYKITFVTAVGETQGGTEFTITTTTNNTNVALSVIPLGSANVTSRKIYRTQVGGATGTEKLVTTIANNTATTYTDNSSDASITGNAAVPTTNTTGQQYSNTSSGTGNVLYGLNASLGRIVTDGGGNDLEWDNMPELFWNRANPDISLYSASDNRLDILNAGGAKANLNTQNQLTFGYGDYLGVSPTSSWASGTHKLMEVTWNGVQDQVDIYTPGNTTASSLITLTSAATIALKGTVNIGTNNINTVGNIEIDPSAARDITVGRVAANGGNNLTVQAGGAQSGSTDKGAGTLILASGIATGTGSGSIQFQTATNSTTGTTDRSPSLKAWIGASGTCQFFIGPTTSVSGVAAGLNFTGETGAWNVLNTRRTASNSAGNNLTIQSGGATSAATDKNGGNLILASGLATGTGSGIIQFQTSKAQASTNTTDNALATVGTWDGNGRLFVGGTTTPTAVLHLAAGAAAASSAPLKFTSGTNLTTAEVGAVEYDGTQLYGTVDTSSGRGAIPVDQYFHLTSAGSTISTIANYFGSTSNISLVASAYYEIDIYLWYLNTTSGTVTWTLTNSAAPTSQNIFYEMSPVTGLVAPPGTATTLTGETYNDSTAALAITTGTLTTAVNHFAHFKIFLQNGTGTSLKVQATKNVGGTITPGINSYWFCRRLSSGNVGTFAA